MSRLRDSAVRLVNLFRRERIERELDAELQAYLELDVEENIRRGMAPKEARRMALARLGGVETVKEECRDVQRFRVAEDPGRAAAPLRAAVADVDADQAVFNVRTMEDLVSSSIAQNRFQALLLAFFGIAALLLSGLGIHGVVSYLLVQRRREFAIRLVLGSWMSVLAKSPAGSC